MIGTISQQAAGIANPAGLSHNKMHPALRPLLRIWPMACLLLWLGASVSQGQTPADFIWTTNADNTISLYTYTGAGGAVTLPSTITGMTVSDIGYSAFLNNDSFTSVVIPGSIQVVGAGAFYGCSNMTSLTISNGVAELETNAFGYCIALAAVDLPASVTNVLDYAFYECAALTNAVVENGAAAVGGFVFASCSNLVSATFPGGDFPANSDFYGCPKLSEIVISPGSPFIGNYQFGNIASITSVSIPDSVTSIGDTAFQQCYGLTSIAIPGSVTNLGQYVFFGCSNLVAVTMSAGLQAIGADAFADCSALASLTIAASVTNIGDYAFYGCSNLVSAVVPNGAAAVGYAAFDNCPSLTSATIPGNPNVNGAASIFVGDPKLQTIAISSGTTSIPYAEFLGFTNLVSLTIPGTVASIGDFAFYNLGALTSLTIANGVQSIGNGSFEQCASLDSATIPGSVGQIGTGAFASCANLQTITLSAGIGTLGDYLFESCSNLNSITIPGSVTNVGAGLFYQCTGLTNAVIMNGVPNIGDYQFYGCASLGNTAIPGSVTNIGTLAFYGDNLITSVATGSGVKSIGSYAFAFNPSLLSIVINGPVTSMGSSAFEVCSNVTSLVLSSGVTYIGTNCFLYLRHLHSVSLPASLAFIAESAFSECYGLSSYYFYGDAPAVSATGVFQYDREFARAVAFHLRSTAGWTASFGGTAATNSIPTQIWSGGDGSVEVSLSPSAAVAAAQWQVDGGAWQNSGATVSGLLVGSHIISYSSIPGYVTPANQSVSISASSNPRKVAVVYKVGGYATVTIGPAAVVKAGAEWQIDGGAPHRSGAPVAVAIGRHSLTFTGVADWYPPARQMFTVATDATTNLAGTYIEQYGSVEVTITPALAVSAAAMWQIDGGELQKSGTTLPEISAGAHTLSFTSISGLSAPANRAVIVPNKGTARVTAAYYFSGEGTYNGLFTGAPDTAEQTSGMISGLSVSSTGSYSGRIYADGASTSFSGSFNLAGASSAVAKFSGKTTPLLLNLTANFTNTPMTIIGAVTTDVPNSWVSYVTNEIEASGSRSAEYTAAIAPQDTNPPSGYGYILITNKAGMATLTVAMADGATFTQNVPVSGAADIPLYGNLYGKTGLVTGWLSLASNKVSGTLTWVKPHSSAALYGDGFTNLVSVTGYPWLNHSSTNLTGDLLTIEGPSLPSQLSYALEVSSKDQVTATAGSNTSLRGSITSANGKMTIRFGSGAGSAVVLQAPDGSSSVAGFIATKTNSGSIYSTPPQ